MRGFTLYRAKWRTEYRRYVCEILKNSNYLIFFPNNMMWLSCFFIHLQCFRPMAFFSGYEASAYV